MFRTLFALAAVTGCASAGLHQVDTSLAAVPYPATRATVEAAHEGTPYTPTRTRLGHERVCYTGPEPYADVPYASRCFHMGDDQVRRREVVFLNFPSDAVKRFKTFRKAADKRFGEPFYNIIFTSRRTCDRSAGEPVDDAADYLLSPTKKDLRAAADAGTLCMARFYEGPGGRGVELELRPSTDHSSMTNVTYIDGAP